MSEQKKPLVPPGVDLERPSAARVYDWALGGTANWAIDREFGEQAVRNFPMVRTVARVNRDFLGRAVRYCVQAGVTQFLDLGSGVPTVGNVHEVADQVNPESACVYVDNEPVAVAHSQVLLEQDGDPRRHAAIQADMRDVQAVWHAALDTGVLDPTQPIGLIMVAMLHFVPNSTGAHEAVEGYRRLLPEGSHLVISHVTDSDVADEELEHVNRLVQQYEKSSTPACFRDREEITRFFGDFTMVDPGLVPIPRWRPVDDLAAVTQLVPNSPMTCVLGGIGRKTGKRTGL